MRLFVFGSGATRGASFVDISKNPCFPPLDSDFFTQLQRIQNPKHQETIKKVIEDTIELFGPNFQLTLETVFSTLENIIRMVKTAGEQRDFGAKKLDEMKVNLLQAIAAVLEESLTKQKDKSSRNHQVCEHHKSIVEMLEPKDSIISFNYDCLLDYSLKLFGNGKWSPHYGYGFPLRRNGGLKGYKYWEPEHIANKDKTVRLYKLHGSLHFRFNGNIVTLKERPYTRQQGNLRFEIIPPEVKKDFDNHKFARLWKCAGSAIHKAKTIVIVGYSFPRTDLHATALFQISLKSAGLEKLVIVNPDKTARYRARDILRRGITKKTRIYSFDSLKDFIEAKIDLDM